VVSEIREALNRFGRLVLEQTDGEGLRLRAADATTAAQLAATRRLTPLLGPQDGLSFAVPTQSRGALKQALVHAGWPVDDRSKSRREIVVPLARITSATLLPETARALGRNQPCPCGAAESSNIAARDPRRPPTAPTTTRVSPRESPSDDVELQQVARIEVNHRAPRDSETISLGGHPWVWSPSRRGAREEVGRVGRLRRRRDQTRHHPVPRSEIPLFLRPPAIGRRG